MDNNEWYTPTHIIEAARRVLGTIDLDPASSYVANQTVQARAYYTQEESGLAHNWYGRIWLNPPYGMTRNKSNQGIFIAKLQEEYMAHRVRAAIALTIANTQAQWFTPLWNHLICFNYREIPFINPHKPGARCNCRYAYCFTYFGVDDSLFIENFAPFGTIVRAIASSKKG